MSTVKEPRLTSGRVLTGFKSLSPEIILSIIQQLPDLISLDSILRASPSSFRVFNAYGTEIMDTIISSAENHGHIRAMIRISALIRTSRLPIDNLADFVNKTTISAMTERIRSLRTNLSPLSLEKDTPPAVLRGILASNRHLVQMSLKLLKTYLQRFRAVKPRQPVANIPIDFQITVDKLLDLPEDKWEDIPIEDAGPPNWAEEQRVIRAFWRLQIFYDMKKAAIKRRLPGWSEDDLHALEEMTLKNFYGSFFVVQAAHPQLSPEPHPEHHELTSIVVYLCEHHSLYDLTHITKSSCFTPPYPPVEVKREWVVKSFGYSQFEPWRKGVGLFIIKPSDACYFYCHQFLAHFKFRVPFEEFGKLGFAFWGPERMYRYRLLPSVSGWSQDGVYTSRWCSMLSREVLSDRSVPYQDVLSNYP